MPGGYLQHLPAKPMIAGAMALLLLVGWADYFTGPDLSFSLFYLPSIAVVAWFGGKWWGILAAGEGAIIWFMADYYGGAPLPLVFYLWNAFVRLCIFIITAFFARSLQLQITSLQNTLTQKTSELQAFHRLLPVCAHCSRIRDELGHWRHIEAYIKEKTDTELSQGICPDCAEKYDARD